MTCPNCDESMIWCDMCAGTRVVVRSKEDWDQLSDAIKQILTAHGLN